MRKEVQEKEDLNAEKSLLVPRRGGGLHFIHNDDDLVDTLDRLSHGERGEGGEE